LRQIEVIDTHRNNRYLLPCDKWLSREKEDKEIARELYPLINDVEKVTSSMSSRKNNYDENYQSRSLSFRSDKKKYDFDDFELEKYNLRDKGSLSNLSDRDLYYR
jgi:hypothetical protein